MNIIKIIRNAIATDKNDTMSSSESAKERLHILLIQDRTGMYSPEFLPDLRAEIIEVIKKYLPVVDNDAVEIKYDNVNDTHILEMSVSLDHNTSSHNKEQDK